MRYAGHNNDGEPMSSATVHTDSRPDTDYYDDTPSMTRQEFAEEADINVLMARFEATGLMPSFNKGEPRYIDVSSVPNMQEALHIMEEATAAFMALDARTRRRFENDPQQFVAFAQDPKNVDQLREWGLAAPLPQKPEPQEVRVVNPEPAEPAKK